MCVCGCVNLQLCFKLKCHVNSWWKLPTRNGCVCDASAFFLCHLRVLNSNPLQLVLCKWRVSRIKLCKTASVWPAIHPRWGLKERNENTENLALVLISIWLFKRGDFHPWLHQRVQSSDKRLSEFSALTKQFSQKPPPPEMKQSSFCLLRMLLPCLFSPLKDRYVLRCWKSSWACQGVNRLWESSRALANSLEVWGWVGRLVIPNDPVRWQEVGRDVAWSDSPGC